MKPVVFRASAGRDLTNQGDWLDAQRSGLGDELLAQVRDAVRLIRARPEAFAVHVPPDVRRFVIEQFGILMFYVDEPGRVVILTIAHGRQSPSSIRRRVRAALKERDELS